MIKIHHLNDSRSQRILWLMEELGLAYEIAFHQRDPETRLAPPSLLAVHPLGKSPVVEMEGETLIESGAIIETVIRRKGGGRLAPAEGSPDFDRYVEWLHYAEGSAMLPPMLRLYVSRLGEAGAPLHPRIESETANHFGFIEGALAGRDWLVGQTLSGADIQMSFLGEIAKAQGMLPRYPAIAQWVGRFQALPAYQRALARGGPYSFA